MVGMTKEGPAQPCPSTARPYRVSQNAFEGGIRGAAKYTFHGAKSRREIAAGWSALLPNMFWRPRTQGSRLSVDLNENGMRSLLAQELEPNRRHDAPLQLAHGNALDLDCAAARVTPQTSKSGEGEGGKEGKPDYGDAAMRGAIWSVHATVTRPPSGAAAASQRERGASDRNREDTSRDGQTATMTTILANQNTYKQLSACLRP